MLPSNVVFTSDGASLDENRGLLQIPIFIEIEEYGPIYLAYG